MKLKPGLILYSLLLCAMPLKILQAQEDCVLQPPVIRIDFGDNSSETDPNISSLENYHRVYDYCPQDGNYTILSATTDCFSGHWISLNQDHTNGDNGGKMLLVNAAYNPGTFFVAPLRGLLPNTSYELGAWVVNVCKPEYECTYIRPDLRFVVTTVSGTVLAKFSTGEIVPTGRATWMQYAAMFKTPAEAGTLLLKIENKSNGGCGNDFAMDDITLRECIFPLPIVKEVPKPKPLVKQLNRVAKPVVQPGRPVLKPLKESVSTIVKKPEKQVPGTASPVIKGRHNILLPDPILTRANPIVKQIETTASGIEIALYDNGEIDGDTVSIYHNNELVVSRAGLSAKPVIFHFNVDVTHPHHELVMVANNLGSIPPNTSLMILTSKDKRYEVFISSSEQKNAKVVIDLKE